MKKYILILSLALLSVSCNRQYDLAMKSADKDLILKTANEMYTKKKWKEALSLYERVQNLISGTDEASDILFKSAYANYYDKQYRIAGHQFKKFSVNSALATDPRKEEAAYMSAICYYQGSMDYNLDQKDTELAINELQSFLNNYPNSERAKNINELIDELSYKLEFKAYENARQYYKMLELKSAIISFENVLDDFPSTKLRPKIETMLMDAKAKLAIDSKFELKRERLEHAVAYTHLMGKNYPDTDIAKTAVSLRKKLDTELETFAKLEKLVEQKREELKAKEKEREEKEKATK
ncbi:outer membrane protein assembly factor BamD [Riemerella anatipestifer]|uniref:outer membrane protein assembly factor BamD n=1 Tax=Riemerella anatipestifer TaxID=34085 RepID=UPI001BDA2E42|nr:outer membrane protein assembly factor BamD [Riemerella anatipestifer]MBT0551351.1 outer membrane protein assembly factor BamD [Riemerella anatipestifer]MCE3024067.1 outer membrane protein assembly factor BamD [Riemerella anatipestifer]MCU7542778.1 outer membrane protein assembly factor BamD [Riemerella anatipestifer]MCW0513477.1 outer membrane protein assembly factor BamD [Riemerella anatipestifer]MDY3376138.1 outer membrane protein assembly factor BamD [Riemerella anatipestifer]